jgi:hypothetical protein
MKKMINFSKYIFVLILALSFNACKDYFGDVNVDPNTASVAPPSTLLPTIEARITYTYWGDFSRYASIYTQQLKGADRQFATYQGYSFVPDDFTTVWSNCYEGTLMDIQQLKKAADATNSNTYGGIARALEAYTIMMIADYWGDAPYSDAFKGDEVLQPKYDTQEQLYTTAFSLLNDARTKLAAPSGQKPSAAIDIIYGGDPAKWIKFCNVLAARAYLHLGKKDAANYAKGLAELNKGGFASKAEEATFQFLAAETGSAPWNQYLIQRGGDVSNGLAYTKMAADLADPRGDVKSYGAAFDDKNPFFVANQKSILLGFTEMKFIEAELLNRTGGDAAKTKTALEDGIKSSMGEAKITDAAAITAYLANPKVSPTVATLEAIMTQKYMALFVNPEVLNDIRRTDIPKLTPNKGNEIPRRFLYPQSELDLNGNAPKGLKVFDKVGWDK